MNLNSKRYLTELEWGQVLAVAWQQPEFKAQLEKDPKGAIKEHFPLLTFENVLRVPSKPGDLSEHELPDIIEGSYPMPSAFAGCCCCCC